MTAQATRKATRKAPRAPGQIRSLLRAVHPRQALAFAVVVGTLVALTGRPGREIALSAVTVFVAQLILGLLNDLLDLDRDRMGGAKNKPIAEGIIPPGNASFAIAVLLLLVIPLSLQNGTRAGLLMPASPKLGDVFEPERAPGIAQERSKVVSTSRTIKVPAGTFKDCLEAEVYDPIGKTTVRRWYCPGAGLVKEAGVERVIELASREPR